MKFSYLHSFIIGCTAIMSINAMNDEMKDMVRSIVDDCKKSEGAQDSDVEMITNEDYPTSKEGKCMLSCLQEQFGITKDGEYQLESAKSILMMAAGDDEAKKNEVESIAEACKNEDDPDRCEKAVKIGKCLEKEGRARGFDAE